MKLRLKELIQLIEPLAYNDTVILKNKYDKQYTLRIGLTEYTFDGLIECEVFKDGKYMDAFMLESVDWNEPPWEGVCGIDLYSEDWYAHNLEELKATVKRMQDSLNKIEKDMTK